MISVPAQPKTLLEELQAKILATSGCGWTPVFDVTQTPPNAMGEGGHIFYPLGGETSMHCAETGYSKR
jgi:hypothetical protein